MKERRKYTRASVELPAVYGLADDDDQNLQATLVNISAEGFCFFTNQALAKDTAVVLNIQLEDSEIQMKASTAWSKKIGDTGDYMTGVEITDATGADLQKFLKYYCQEISQLIVDLQKIKNN